MGQYDNLFELIEVGGVIIFNCIVCVFYGMFLCGDDLIVYYQVWVKGGVGMLMFEVINVYFSVLGVFFLWLDDCILFYEKFFKIIVFYGMKFFQ